MIKKRDKKKKDLKYKNKIINDYYYFFFLK